MALFKRKKEEEKEKEAVVDVAPVEKKPKPTKVDLKDRDLSSVIVKPRITEKAALQHERNIYTFEVRRDATKYDVRDAVKELWGVTPLKINIVNQKPREFISRMRGRRGTKAGLRKAYIYLKDGDRIELA